MAKALFLFPRATGQVVAFRHLATAARVKYHSVLRTHCALQRCKFDTPLLAARFLIDKFNRGGGKISYCNSYMTDANIKQRGRGRDVCLKKEKVHMAGYVPDPI